MIEPEVCFCHIPDDETFELKKWQLADVTGDSAEALVLQGWRRILGMAFVQEMLRSRHKKCDAQALADWPLGLPSPKPIYTRYPTSEILSLMRVELRCLQNSGTSKARWGRWITRLCPAA